MQNRTNHSSQIFLFQDQILTHRNIPVSYTHLDVYKRQVYALADRLRQKLAAIDSVQLTDEGQERCGIVTFMSTHMPAPDIQTALAQHRINVSSSGPLGTIYSFRQRNLGHVVRASVHYFNTFEEIDYFCDTLTRCLQEK